MKQLLSIFILFYAFSANAQCNLGFSWSYTDCTQYGVCDGTITLWVSGGTPPYTFGIDGGTLTTQTVNNTIYTFTGLCPGTYDLFVWDQTMTACPCATGCGGTGTPSVTITEPAPDLNANGLLILPQCTQDFGPGSLEITITGDAPPFEISFDGGFSWAPASSPYYYPGLLNCQTPPPSVLVRDAFGQVVSASYVYPPNACQAAPLVEVIIQNDCGGTCQGRVGFTIDPFDWDVYSPYTIYVDEEFGTEDFSFPGAVGILNSPSDTFWVENLCADFLQYYPVNINGCGYLSPLPFQILNNSEPAPPTITTNGSTSFCTGDSVILTSSETTGNLWSTYESSTSITVDTSGNYSVSYTDGNGCSSTSDTISIVAFSLPTSPIITPSGPSTFCMGDSVVLTSNPASNILWSTLETSSSIVVNSSGNYYVEYSDTNGCQSTSQLNVTVNPPPLVDAGVNQTLCFGDSTLVFGSGASSYTWNNGLQDSTSFVPQVGVNTFNVTGTDTNGCQNTDSLSIVVNALPAITAGQDVEICEGDSILLSASGGIVYLWDGGVIDSISFLPQVGFNTFNVIGTDTNGCQNTDSLSIVVNALPAITAGQDVEICEGDSILLSASGGIVYLWDSGVIDSIPFLPQVGFNTFNVIGTDTNGCQNTDSLSVVVNVLPTITAGQDVEICEGDSVILNGLGGTSYTWSNGVSNGEFFAPPVGINNYLLTGLDTNGCENTDSLTISVYLLPNLTFEPLGTICVYNDPFTLSTAQPQGGIYSGAGVSNNIFDPSIGVGTFTITYSYVDSNSCENSVSSDIIVDNCLDVKEIINAQIEVFPNPIRDEVTLKMTGSFEYSLYDLHGRILLSGDGQNIAVQSTQSLRAGMYILHVHSANNDYTFQIRKVN